MDELTEDDIDTIPVPSDEMMAIARGSSDRGGPFFAYCDERRRWVLGLPYTVIQDDPLVGNRYYVACRAGLPIDISPQGMVDPAFRRSEVARVALDNGADVSVLLVGSAGPPEPMSLNERGIEWLCRLIFDADKSRCKT